MCDELKQANKIIKKLHDSNQEQTQKVVKYFKFSQMSFSVVNKSYILFLACFEQRYCIKAKRRNSQVSK